MFRSSPASIFLACLFAFVGCGDDSVARDASVRRDLGVSNADAEPLADAANNDDAEADAAQADAAQADASPMDAEPMDAEPMDAEQMDAEPGDAIVLDAEFP